jgi:carboxyl-terminal processing protease
MMKKQLKRYWLVGILVLGIGFTGFKMDDRYFEIAKNLDIFATMFKELNAFYVDEVNPNRAMRSSIEAMLKELDPYTVFYPEDDIEDYMTMAAGKYNGIGATVSSFDGAHTVVMIFEESPADKSGIKIGDDILKINGIDITNKDESEFGRLLKGQTGTSVKLTIKRFGQAKPIEISVNRDIVKTPNVPNYGMINEEVGYIQLSDFSITAAKEIKASFGELKDKGMTKLVLDLRGNPGGLLNMSIDICNFFVPKGNLVVETKGKVGEWNKKYLAMNAPIDTEIPIVVLINGQSASASEIVSGTLQDYDRGVLIGQRSFGKGLVQTTRDLSFNSKLKITTAKYYIPSGRCIQALDYSHRNPDGSVGKVPDSLKSAFKTKNGRVVYDGGGVEPDIVLEAQVPSTLTQALIREKKIFDYATKYYFEHQSTKPENNFALTEQDYQNFMTWIKNEQFTYQTPDEKAIEEVVTSSKSSADYTKMKASLDEIKKIASESKSKSFITFKEEIKDQLELEILSRYYYQKAMKFVSFEKDQEVQEALKLFKNMNKYKAILAGK